MKTVSSPIIRHTPFGDIHQVVKILEDLATAEQRRDELDSELTPEEVREGWGFYILVKER